MISEIRRNVWMILFGFVLGCANTIGVWQYTGTTAVEDLGPLYLGGLVAAIVIGVVCYRRVNYSLSTKMTTLAFMVGQEIAAWWLAISEGQWGEASPFLGVALAIAAALWMLWWGVANATAWLLNRVTGRTRYPSAASHLTTQGDRGARVRRSG